MPNWRRSFTERWARPDLMEFMRFDLGEVLRKRNCAAEHAFRSRQSHHHEPDGSARPERRFVRSGNHSDRPASGWSLSLVRPDGDLPSSIREFRGYESGSRSGVEAVFTAVAK